MRRTQSRYTTLPTQSERERIRRVVSQVREWRTAEWIALAAGLTVLKAEEQWRPVVSWVLDEMVRKGEIEQVGGLYCRGSNLPASRWDSDQKQVVPVRDDVQHDHDFGHRTYLADPDDKYEFDNWRYVDTNESIHEVERPCPACHRHRTPAGHDPCIADLPGVKAACCGHGDPRRAYVMLGIGDLPGDASIRGAAALEWAERKKMKPRGSDHPGHQGGRAA
jgi:hypothetical protein